MKSESGAERLKVVGGYHEGNGTAAFDLSRALFLS